MYSVSALAVAFNHSTFGQTVARISAQDNLIGAVASVFFSRPGFVFACGIGACKLGDIFVGLHTDVTDGKKGWEKFKIYFSILKLASKKFFQERFLWC